MSSYHRSVLWQLSQCERFCDENWVVIFFLEIMAAKKLATLAPKAKRKIVGAMAMADTYYGSLASPPFISLS